MNDCIFCQIVENKIPSLNVYENENVLAFLDIKPLTKGHSLVIPKKHLENIFDIDKENLQKVVVAAKHIAEVLKKSLSADGIRISQSSGQAAGQEVMHFHLHVIPRYLNDDLHGNAAATARPLSADFEELKKIAEIIASQ